MKKLSTEPCQRTAVTLPDAFVFVANIIGEGNRTKGIRKALKYYALYSMEAAITLPPDLVAEIIAFKEQD